MGISPEQFAQLKARVTGRRKPASVVRPEICAAPPIHHVVLGIDPSLRGTGFGIIQLARPNATILAQGTIVCPASWEHSRCLAAIFDQLQKVVQHHKPTVCVVEGLFYTQNLKTAITMGHARGAAIVAAARAGCEIYELAPRKVKNAIVGYGGAQKFAVAKMVQRLLHLVEVPDSDAADALALALAWSQLNRSVGLAQPRRI